MHVAVNHYFPTCSLGRLKIKRAEASDISCIVRVHPGHYECCLGTCYELLVFSFRPLLSSHKFAKTRVTSRVEFREGRLSLMMKIVVSSANSTVDSGGRIEGRSLMKAEKRAGRSIKPCGMPEHGNQKEWYQLCTVGRLTTNLPTNSVINQQGLTVNFTCICGHSFRRQGDLTRHQRFCHEMYTCH